jgi:hypothetical protein
MATTINPTCSICYEDMNKDDTAVGHIGEEVIVRKVADAVFEDSFHAFHAPCLMRWLTTPDAPDSCPMCRAVLSKDNLVAAVARNGDREFIKDFFANRDPLFEKERGIAVIEAANDNNLETMRALLSDGATISEEDRGVAVCYAAALGNMSIVQELLLNDARISPISRGVAVRAAASIGRLEIVQALLPQGAEIPERLRRISVREALSIGRLDIVQVLLPQGATISEEDRGEAVCYAAKSGDLESVRTLLANGPIELKSRYKAVVDALKYRHYDVAAELTHANAIITGSLTLSAAYVISNLYLYYSESKYQY